MKRVTFTILFVLFSTALFAGSIPAVVAPALDDAKSKALTAGGYVIAGVVSFALVKLALAHLRLMKKTSRSVAQRKKELAYRRSVHRYYRKKYGRR